MPSAALKSLTGLWWDSCAPADAPAKSGPLPGYIVRARWKAGVSPTLVNVAVGWRDGLWVRKADEKKGRWVAGQDSAEIAWEVGPLAAVVRTRGVNVGDVVHHAEYLFPSRAPYSVKRHFLENGADAPREVKPMPVYVATTVAAESFQNSDKAVAAVLDPAVGEAVYAVGMDHDAKPPSASITRQSLRPSVFLHEDAQMLRPGERTVVWTFVIGMTTSDRALLEQIAETHAMPPRIAIQEVVRLR